MATTRGTGLSMMWADIDPAVEAEHHHRYDEEHLPQLPSVRGCVGARCNVAVDGQPKYLALCEFEHATVSDSEPRNGAREGNPRSNRIRPFMSHDIGSPGVYRRIDKR